MFDSAAFDVQAFDEAAFSFGGVLATVPNVVGEAEADAITAIEAENLIASVQRAYSGSVAEGDVISQDPAAASEVEEGSTVTIVVSRGTAPVSSGIRRRCFGFGFGFGAK